MDTGTTRAVGAAGFALLEWAITMTLIVLVLAVVGVFQCNARTAMLRSNATLVAGRLIEQKIELMRRTAAGAPDSFQAKLVGGREEDVESGVVLEWEVNTVADPLGVDTTGVREVTLRAFYGSDKPETLAVTACLARDFPNRAAVVDAAGDTAK